MSDKLVRKPPKGILKTTRSVESHDEPSTSRKSKEQRFDEMNIIATLHPADKDYGHMKIDEPKTPYAELSDTNLNPQDHVDANILAARLAASMNQPPRSISSSSTEEDSEEETQETEEQKRHRIEFEKKRKMHYNEFQAIQLAKKLLEEDEDDEDNNTKDSLPSSQQMDVAMDERPCLQPASKCSGKKHKK